MEYADGKLLAQVDGGVGIVTLNNPEKRNAMTLEMSAAFGEVLKNFNEDPTVKVVIMTGAGDKAFGSGADVSEYQNRMAEFRKTAQATRVHLLGLRKPLIARIRGACVGGGLLQAIQCDLRIASEDSTFGIPTARLGNSPPVETLRKLIALVGQGNVGMMLYTAGRFTAAEALQMGLVNRVVPPEHLTDTVMEIARSIAKNAPLALAAGKLVLSDSLKDPADRDPAAVEQAMSACFASEDFKEGRAAFKEKRTPNFQGR